MLDVIDKFKREEAVSKKASGIQESLDAINVQSVRIVENVSWAQNSLQRRKATFEK